MLADTEVYQTLHVWNVNQIPTVMLEQGLVQLALLEHIQLQAHQVVVSDGSS